MLGSQLPGQCCTNRPRLAPGPDPRTPVTILPGVRCPAMSFTTAKDYLKLCNFRYGCFTMVMSLPQLLKLEQRHLTNHITCFHALFRSHHTPHGCVLSQSCFSCTVRPAYTNHIRIPSDHAIGPTSFSAMSWLSRLKVTIQHCFYRGDPTRPRRAATVSIPSSITVKDTG